jgi:hypothetical protein
MTANSIYLRALLTVTGGRFQVSHASSLVFGSISKLESMFASHIGVWSLGTWRFGVRYHFKEINDCMNMNQQMKRGL